MFSKYKSEKFGIESLEVLHLDVDSQRIGCGATEAYPDVYKTNCRMKSFLSHHAAFSGFKWKTKQQKVCFYNPARFEEELTRFPGVVRLDRLVKTFAKHVTGNKLINTKLR